MSRLLFRLRVRQPVKMTASRVLWVSRDACPLALARRVYFARSLFAEIQHRLPAVEEIWLRNQLAQMATQTQLMCV